MRPWSPEWKQAKLEELETEWYNCQACELSYLRESIVFGEGNPDADVMLIGVAPGEREDEEGRPFVGPSGELLDSFIENMKVSREELYITNLVMCHPPDNRDPMAAERGACWERLRSQIYIVDPKILVLLGAEPLKALGGSAHKSISGSLNTIFDVFIEGVFFDDKKKRGLLRYPAMVVYHPSYILRYDSVDPETGQWRHKYPAYWTYIGIEKAVNLSQELNYEYDGALERRFIHAKNIPEEPEQK